MNRAMRALLSGMAFTTVALTSGACSSPSPVASNLTGPSSATAEAASSVTAVATSSPTRAPEPTPIPTLSSTSEGATVAPPGAISIQMAFVKGEPRFVPDQVTAQSDKVTFFLPNVRPESFMPQDHNMAIGPEIRKVLARSPYVRVEKAAVFTIEGLTPGTYTFWCELGVHAAEGMVGTLTITD